MIPASGPDEAETIAKAQAQPSPVNKAIRQRLMISSLYSFMIYVNVVLGYSSDGSRGHFVRSFFALSENNRALNE